MDSKVKRGRESIEDDRQSGHPNGATLDENVKVVQTLAMCDGRRDLQSNQHLRYVKGFNKMDAVNVDQ